MQTLRNSIYGQRVVGGSEKALRTSIQTSEGRWEQLGTHSQDLLLKVRGEVGDSVPTLRTSI